jgi:two-component system sensor histidine kinase AtoS
MENILCHSPELMDQKRLTTDTNLSLLDLIHEIRNPLNGMDTTLQLMARHVGKVRSQEDPVLVSYVQAMRKEIHRINTMLMDLQALWRADLQLAPIAIDDVIADLLKIEPLISAACGIRLDLATRLPLVLADDRLFKRVLSNLIKNSLEAMPDGGVLTIRAYAQAAFVVVEIIDTGSGVPQDVRIFDPFSTSKPEGMGLGLNIVQRIVSGLGGQIAYSTEAGSGTTFRVSLPQYEKEKL